MESIKSAQRSSNSYPGGKCPKVEDLLKPYEDALERETRMVSETQIWLNKCQTKQVKIGLSPVLYFLPTIKIEDAVSRGLAFSMDTFISLISINLDWEEKRPATMGEYTLTHCTYANAIRIEKFPHHVILGYEAYCNLINLATVIGAKMDLLQRQGFIKYYNTMLRCGSDSDDILKSVKRALSRSINDQNRCCMLEVIAMHPAKVLDDSISYLNFLRICGSSGN